MRFVFGYYLLEEIWHFLDKKPTALPHNSKCCHIKGHTSSLFELLFVNLIGTTKCIWHTVNLLLNPFVNGNCAEKHILKLVEQFSDLCHAMKS